LHAYMPYDVYCSIPPGFPTEWLPNSEPFGVSHYCLKLLKTLYGLLVAARSWYELLSSKLKLMGYVKLTNDPCIVLQITGADVTTLLAVHVDDI
jgi:hypothetical protein